MKKTFLKLTSALTAFCLIFGTVASAAAVQSGGTEWSCYTENAPI